MQTSAHLPILRRAGHALVAAGLLDIAAMVYCVSIGESYASSLNIVAVVAGVFLIRGNLRAAALVRWFSLLLASGVLTLVATWPLFQPIGLTLAQIRFDPASYGLALIVMTLTLGLLLWVARQLGQEPVRQALSAAGIKRRPLHLPLLAGAAIVGLGVALSGMLLDGDTASKAISIAEKQLGPGFKYHVSSLQITSSRSVTQVEVTVTAWNAREIRDIPVQWEER